MALPSIASRHDDSSSMVRFTGHHRGTTCIKGLTFDTVGLSWPRFVVLKMIINKLTYFSPNLFFEKVLCPLRSEVVHSSNKLQTRKVKANPFSHDCSWNIVLWVNQHFNWQFTQVKALQRGYKYPDHLFMSRRSQHSKLRGCEQI